MQEDVHKMLLVKWKKLEYVGEVKILPKMEI